MSHAQAPAPIDYPSLLARVPHSPAKPSVWHTTAAPAQPAHSNAPASPAAEHAATAPPPLTDQTSWPDVSSALTPRGRQPQSPGGAQSAASADASARSSTAPSPSRRASSRGTKKQKWVQIAPSELLAAADAAQGRGTRPHNHASPLHSRNPRAAPPPVPPLPVDDVFVVRHPNHVNNGTSASSATTSTTSPSSSLASLGPPQRSQHSRQSPSLSVTSPSLTHESHAVEPPAATAKRVAPAQAGPVSGYRDLEHVPSVSGRVVVFGSVQDSTGHAPTASEPVEQEPAQVQHPPQDLHPSQDSAGDAAAAASAHFASLSLSSTDGHAVSPAFHPAWYPPPDAWQLPASTWQQHGMPQAAYVNASTSVAPYETEQQEPRTLSESDRNWSGSSWAAAQATQPPQHPQTSPYPDAAHASYYYQVPPRHAHYSQRHHASQSQQWEYGHDSWEERPRERKERGEKERVEREGGNRDIFEVDYSRVAADRRPREKERDRDRDRDRERSDKDAVGTGVRPRRNSAASAYYPGARRGRSHSQPDGGSTRGGGGRGGYRGGYAYSHYRDRERTYTAGSSTRGLSPDAPPTPTSAPHFSGGRGGGRSSRGHRDLTSELPLPVPQTLIKSVSQMDATKYFVLGQIEFYFGARNLATDFFLRQQMDARGWIPIPLVASFNRVRALTQSGAMVREVMGLSALLEVRGDRVRLRDGLWRPYVTPDAVPSVGDSDDDDDDEPPRIASSVAEVTEDDTDELDEDDEDDDIVFVMT